MTAACAQPASEPIGEIVQQPGANAAHHTGATPPLLRAPQDNDRWRQLIEGGDPAALLAQAALIEAGEAAMEMPIRPVTDGKDEGKPVAPSGDPQDYMSLSPYWWPNPDTPDGTPYIRRDGEINPERHDYDTPKMGDMGKAVRDLAFAYAVSGDERFADRAGAHLRAWFIDPGTRMNPHMRFAQSVPGVADGRAVGIIDTNRLRWVPDSAVILVPSNAWTHEDHTALQRWFAEYLEWLLTSDLGIEEGRARNNHGTWYLAQTALYALFTGQHDRVRQQVNAAKPLLASQIEPNGSQPHELARTRSLDYCDFNIRAYLDLSRYGEQVGVDLFAYESEDGRSLRHAIDYVIPYMTGDEEWSYRQISPPRYHMYYQMLRMAARLYDEPRYEAAAQNLPEATQSVRWIDFVTPRIHELDTMPGGHRHHE
ncbi:MAG: alginate lyase family protein [Planctomycetota bacterium]